MHRRVVAALDGNDVDELGGDEDLMDAFRETSGAVKAALEDPRRATKTVSGIVGEQPFDRLVGRLLCADTLVHSWDLARATGQDDQLDIEATVAALEFLTPIDEAIRRPGGFGPKLVPPPAADVQTQLLAFTGRHA